MNRKRLLLYTIFVIYQGGAFLFTYLVDGHLDLLGLLKYIPWFKWVAFVGFLLIVVDIAWYLIDWKATRKQKKELSDENTDLKAKLYDLQQSARKSEASKHV